MRKINFEQTSIFPAKMKIGTPVQYPILKGGKPFMIVEGTIEAESIVEPGKWFVKGSDRIIRGPYFPDQLLPV